MNIFSKNRNKKEFLARVLAVPLYLLLMPHITCVQAQTPTPTCNVCQASQTITGGSLNPFDGPYGSAIDPVNDILYVADTGNNQVQIFNLNGGTTVTNGGLPLTGFNSPFGLDFYSGFLYVGENDLWVKMTPAGSVAVSVIESSQVRGLSVDRANGDVYEADDSGVNVFQANGNNFVPATTNLSGISNSIGGVLMTGNYLYVADNQASNPQITMFKKNSRTFGNVSFSTPATVWSSGASWVNWNTFQMALDSGNQLFIPGYMDLDYLILTQDPSTGLLTFNQFCHPGGMQPTSVSVDAQGNVYVCGRSPEEFIKITSCGPANTPTPTYPGSDPPETGECFIYPSPARGDHATVSYLMQESGNVTLKIWNEKAELVATVTDSKSTGVQTTPFSISGFATGVYFYSVVINYDSGKSEKISPQKFVILH